MAGGEVLSVTLRGIGALAIALVFWAGAVAVRRSVERGAALLEESRRDVARLLGRAAQLLLVSLGVICALGTLGVDVGAMIAALGLTGFALGFAFRDALSNALAGVLIVLYQPFRRGDRIRVTGFEGRVRHIDLRYTAIEGEKARILIPNGNLLTQVVVVEEPSEAATESRTNVRDAS